MVGGKESKLQHAWDLACYLALLCCYDSMAERWLKRCRRHGRKAYFDTDCLRISNNECTH